VGSTTETGAPKLQVFDRFESSPAADFFFGSRPKAIAARLGLDGAAPAAADAASYRLDVPRGRARSRCRGASRRFGLVRTEQRYRRRQTAGRRPATVSTQEACGAVPGMTCPHGYRVIGPTVEHAAVVLAEIVSINQLPVGWHDEQDRGSYRLARSDDGAFFHHTIGPQSWKKSLFV
jgi:hypothetical protein